jgi:hypothetical protein
MNDFPRQQLYKLIDLHGTILIEDAERCESLLHDNCGPDYKLEIFVLVNAIKEGVVQALLNPPKNVPQDAWLADLTQRLYDNQLAFLGLEKDVAKWAVQTWGMVLSQSQTAQIVNPSKPLSALNPIDYIRLLWWILVKPRQLQIYRRTFGEKDENRVGKWLVSSLTWGPLLIPILASGLERLSLVPENWPPSVYLLFGVLLIGCWLTTGFLGNVGEGNVMSNITFGVMFGMTFGVVYVLANILAFLVAIDVATSQAFGVAYVMAYVVAFYIAYVVAIAVAFSVSDTITNSLITGTPSSSIRIAFLLLVAAELFLFWFCFFEGEQLIVKTTSTMMGMVSL